MTLIGDTMMCEQAGPKQLVRDAALAEEAGFDFAVISDHYFPWLEAQGHSPYAWSVLGAAAQATGRIPLMTYATCPTRCYHPAVVAQKAATMQLLWRPVHRRPRGGRESERAHCRRAMAPRPGAARDARRGRRDHPGAVGGRRGDLPRQALRCRVREGLGPAGHCPADRHRGIGAGQLPAGDGSVPLVHWLLASERRAASPGLVRRGSHDGARG